MDRMNSISKDCNELKHKYDDCFNDWFINGYLKEKPDGKRGANKKAVVPCEALLLAYQECTKQALETKGIKLSEVTQDILGTDQDKSRTHPGGKPKN
uniref:Uncharacterized protein n=1 Tax=Plectus sambesii TaxID=2011161 RepID=A0A914UXC7_9BILA